jgi:hypothetical protein
MNDLYFSQKTLAGEDSYFVGSFMMPFLSCTQFIEHRNGKIDKVITWFKTFW